MFNVPYLVSVNVSAISYLQVYLIVIKTYYFHIHRKDIAIICQKLTERMTDLWNFRDDRIKDLRKFYLLQEYVLFALNFFNGLLLLTAVSFQVQFPIFKPMLRRTFYYHLCNCIL